MMTMTMTTMTRMTTTKKKERKSMIIKHNSDLFESFEDSLVVGWLPMQVEAATPIMRWKGPKIHIKETWWPMLAFYGEHIEHEVQTRFVMDQKQTRIEVVCFNQKYGTGMSYQGAG